MIRTARLKAYAKLNLGLRVLYRRPDGFHELRTVFQTISLADTLDMTFTPARRTGILIEGTPEIADNLVEKAARVVLDAMGIKAELHFRLTKRIPAGAGLGGGSSDAAAVLLALPVLAGKTVAPDKMRQIAVDLGSDVPFFLHGGTALGLGRGEELYPLPDHTAAHALLIAPAIHSSTAEAYSDLSTRLTSIPLQNKLGNFQQAVWEGNAAEGRGLENDFEEPVFGRYPALRRLKERLRRSGARFASMTGSGSALFGVFDDRAALQEALKSFKSEKTVAISFVNRKQYRRSWQKALKLHSKGDQWPPRSLYAR